jgi:hypothetical protein
MDSMLTAARSRTVDGSSQGQSPFTELDRNLQLKNARLDERA